MFPPIFKHVINLFQNNLFNHRNTKNRNAFLYFIFSFSADLLGARPTLNLDRRSSHTGVMTQRNRDQRPSSMKVCKLFSSGIERVTEIRFSG